jgi:hypothetical protein
MASEDNKRLHLLRNGHQQFSPLHPLKVLLDDLKGSLAAGHAQGLLCRPGLRRQS